MNKLINYVSLSKEEKSKIIIRHYCWVPNEKGIYFLEEYPVNLGTSSFYKQIWFDPKTLMVHHPTKPAVESVDVVEYYNQGKLHRNNGKALFIGSNSNYAFNGIICENKKEFKELKYLARHPELEAFL